jgi:hypothetical protein
MSNARVWRFRALVAAAAGVMLLSWFMPWWTCNVEELGEDIVQIRPWGLVVDQRMGGFEVLIKDAQMPQWFTPMMWAYLALCMLALLTGLFLRGQAFGIGRLKIKLSQLLIGGVGFSYIVAAIVAVVYASMRLKGFFEVPLQGRILIDLGEPMITYVNTHLLLGYYLVYVAGLLLVVLALLRDKITGEVKPTV